MSESKRGPLIARVQKRAAFEGVLGSLADASDLLTRYGVGFHLALLIGGGSLVAAPGRPRSASGAGHLRP